MNGADILAAVAFGARAVLIGRAYLYGLMVGGERGVTRVLDILKDETEGTSFDPALLREPEEHGLAERLARLEADADQASLLRHLAELAEPLEAFFTAVMVKCEDPVLRGARLALLRRLRGAFLRVADFSLWQ